MSEQEIEGEGAPAPEIVEVDEEQDDIYPPADVQRQLTHDLLKKGLEKIGKVSSGKNHAFTELNCEKKKIQNLFDILVDYQHLRVINLKQNWLTDLSTLSSIKYLTKIDVSNNRVESLDAFCKSGSLMFLEELNLSGNKISELQKIEIQNLKVLDLSKNIITTCENFRGHPTLRVLVLRKNKLTNLEGVECLPNLEELYAAENPLTTISNLKDLPSLKKLHLRKTELKVLSESVPFLQNLVYINLRESKLDKKEEMKALTEFKELRTLNVLATEMAENTEYNIKEELIMLMPKLKRINKENIEAEEVADALNKLKERLEEQERQRIEEEEKRKEEEERLRLEEEEKAKNPDANNEEGKVE